MMGETMCKAMAAAGCVLAVTMVRRAYPGVGGWVAALPLTSVPALFLLALERGEAFAADASTAALWATGWTGVLAALYARLLPRLQALTAASAALAGAVVLAWPTHALSTDPAAAAALAFLSLVAAKRWLPAGRAVARPDVAWRGDAAMLSLGAAAMSLIVAALAPHCGAAWCGAVAALPVVGICSAVAAQRDGGQPVLRCFLHAYLQGLFAKAAFMLGLSLGFAARAGHAAWGIALSAALAAWAVQRLIALGSSKSAIARSSP